MVTVCTNCGFEGLHSIDDYTLPNWCFEINHCALSAHKVPVVSNTFHGASRLFSEHCLIVQKIFTNIFLCKVCLYCHLTR